MCYFGQSLPVLLLVIGAMPARGPYRFNRRHIDAVGYRRRSYSSSVFAASGTTGTSGEIMSTPNQAPYIALTVHGPSLARSC